MALQSSRLAGITLTALGPVQAGLAREKRREEAAAIGLWLPTPGLQKQRSLFKAVQVSSVITLSRCCFPSQKPCRATGLFCATKVATVQACSWTPKAPHFILLRPTCIYYHVSPEKAEKEVGREGSVNQEQN